MSCTEHAPLKPLIMGKTVTILKTDIAFIGLIL